MILRKTIQITFLFLLISISPTLSFVLPTAPTIFILAVSPPAPTPFSSTVSLEYGMSGYTVDWSISQSMAPASYRIFQNGTDITGNLTFPKSKKGSVSLNGLTPGFYNFTILAANDQGLGTSQVNVTVCPNQAPQISKSANSVTYEVGTTGNILSWLVTDFWIKNYTLIQSNSTSSSVLSSNSFLTRTPMYNLTQNVDGLLVNQTYVYSLSVFDQLGNKAQSNISVSVVKNTPPRIEYNSTDVSLFYYHQSGTILWWKLQDSMPDRYLILLDNMIVRNSTWISGDNITYTLPNLLVGNHNITLTVSDKQGIASNAIRNIQIQPEATFTPEQNIQNKYHINQVYQITGYWLFSNRTGVPKARVNLTLFNQTTSEVILSLNSTTDSKGNFSFSLDLRSVPFGTTALNLTINKYGAVNRTRVYQTEIYPLNISIRFTSQKVLNAGERFDYSFLLGLTYQYSIETGLQQIYRVSVNFTLLYLNSTVKVIQYNLTSSDLGIFNGYLSATTTRGLKELQGVSIQVPGSRLYRQTYFKVPQILLTSIVINLNNGTTRLTQPPTSPPLSTPTLSQNTMFSLNREILAVVLVLISVIFLSFSVYGINLYSKRNLRKFKGLELFLSNLQGFILRTNYGVPIMSFFQNPGMEGALVSGLTTAFSTMLGELEISSEKGFESMKGELGEIMTHKLENTSIILIFDREPKNEYYTKIAECHLKIEEIVNGSSDDPRFFQVKRKEIMAVFHDFQLPIEFIHMKQVQVVDKLPDTFSQTQLERVLLHHYTEGSSFYLMDLLKELTHKKLNFEDTLNRIFYYEVNGYITFLQE